MKKTITLIAIIVLLVTLASCATHLSDQSMNDWWSVEGDQLTLHGTAPSWCQPDTDEELIILDQEGLRCLVKAGEQLWLVDHDFGTKLLTESWRSDREGFSH